MTQNFAWQLRACIVICSLNSVCRAADRSGDGNSRNENREHRVREQTTLKSSFRRHFVSFRPEMNSISESHFVSFRSEIVCEMKRAKRTWTLSETRNRTWTPHNGAFIVCFLFRFAFIVTFLFLFLWENVRTRNKKQSLVSRETRRETRKMGWKEEITRPHTKYLLARRPSSLFSHLIWCIYHRAMRSRAWFDMFRNYDHKWNQNILW